MGCDIHLYKEKLVAGKWVTADEWVPFDYGEGESGFEVPWKTRFRERNYQLFGILAKGVRSEHPFSFEPRGVPYNACAEYQQEQERWDGDGHSHSYLYLHELKALLIDLESLAVRISGMKDRDSLAALQKSIDGGTPNWELIFPYCKWGSGENLVEFSMDVPASFYVGDSVKKIIDGFDGVDGENHRIVFFFDN